MLCRERVMNSSTKPDVVGEDWLANSLCGFQVLVDVNIT